MAIRTHFDTQFRESFLSRHNLSYEIYDVMKMWTADVEKTTKISVVDDLKPVYRLLKNEVKSLE